MAERPDPWWPDVSLAVLIASGFAAIPFWTHGLSIEVATIAAAIIFPSIIAAYIFVVRGK